MGMEKTEQTIWETGNFANATNNYKIMTGKNIERTKILGDRDIINECCRSLENDRKLLDVSKRK